MHVPAWRSSAASLLVLTPVPSADVAVSLDVTFNQVSYEVPDDSFLVSRGIVSLSWLYESFFASAGSILNTDFDHSLTMPLEGESGSCSPSVRVERCGAPAISRSTATCRSTA